MADDVRFLCLCKLPTLLTKMTKNAITRRSLLDRWKGIGEVDDEDHIDPSHQHRLLRQLKEQWFLSFFFFFHHSVDFVVVVFENFFYLDWGK